MFNFKKLSIIIVNYRSKAFLQKCLASLFRFNLGIDFEVAIVNNDEREKLEDIKENFPALILINSPKNEGFGAACNLGADNTRGDLLFFLNPDTEILGSLSPIMDKFGQNPEIGALGPKLLGKSSQAQEWSAGAEISLVNLIKNNLGLPPSKKIWESAKNREVSWVSGAALFVPRKVFSEIGGFDGNFFMYFEDNDLCLRIRQTGKKIIYLPEVAIKHWGGKSFKEKEKEQKEFFFQSQEYYFQKHLGKIQCLALKFFKKFLKKQK